MIRLPIIQVRSGDVLARDVVNPGDPLNTVLPTGTALNERVLKALRNSGFRALWIDDRSTFDGAAWMPPERTERIRRITANLHQTVEETTAAAASGKGLCLRVSPQEIQSLIAVLDSESLFHLPPDEIADNRGSFTHHSVRVACLCLLLGLACKRADPGCDELDNLTPLGMGALLHDIGKVTLPDPVRFRDPWELSRAETNVLKTHTTRGFELLREALGAVAANIPLCHHRNEDGTGYPDILAESGDHLPEGEQVHLFSRIAAVADAYDTLVSCCGYSSLEAMEEVLCARRHHFDPFVLDAFARVVPAFMPGTGVTLNTGHGGVVTGFHPDRPFTPVILLTAAANRETLKPENQKEVDLTNATTSSITHSEGRSIKHLMPSNLKSGWEELA